MAEDPVAVRTEKKLIASLNAIVESHHAAQPACEPSATTEQDLLERVEKQTQLWVQALEGIPRYLDQARETLAERLQKHLRGMDSSTIRTFAGEALLSFAHVILDRVPESIRKAGEGRLVLRADEGVWKAAWRDEVDKFGPWFELRPIAERCVRGLGPDWMHYSGAVADEIVTSMSQGQWQLPSLQAEGSQGKDVVFRWRAPDSVVPFDEWAAVEAQIEKVKPALGEALDRVALADGADLIRQAIDAINPVKHSLSEPIRPLLSKWTTLALQRIEPTAEVEP